MSSLFFIVASIIVAASLALIPLGHYVGGHPWESPSMLTIYLLSGAIIAFVIGIAIILKTVRTRYSVERDIVEHRDVNEYAILWDRPRWILYLPTMIVSIALGIFTFVMPSGDYMATLGGLWVCFVILNVFVEQFHISVRTILIIVPTLAVIILLLHLGGMTGYALRFSRALSIDVPPKLYFMVALVISIVIFVGWFRGLFNYIAITPNVADMQRGLTETGQQIRNEDYDLKFDATDVVERWLFGFGRIIITLPESKGPPLEFFVPHAAKIDNTIRRVRSVTAIDQPNEA